MTEPIWRPSPERAAATQLAAFHRLATARHAVGAGYPALHAWSCAEPDAFWPLLWEALGIVGERGARTLVRGATMADAQFFPDARLSFAENLLARRDDATAIVAIAADGGRRALSFADLAAEVGRVAAGLASGGGSRSRAAGQVARPANRASQCVPGGAARAVPKKATTAPKASCFSTHSSSVSPMFACAGNPNWVTDTK